MDDIDQFRDSVLRFIHLLDQSEITKVQRCSRLNQLIRYIIAQTTEKHNIQFTSLFSRISYLVGHYGISGRESYILHLYRILGRQRQDEEVDLRLRLSQAAVAILTREILSVEVYADIDITALYDEISQRHHDQEYDFIPQLRVYAKEVDLETKHIYAEITEEPFGAITISYGRADRNEDFASIIEQLYVQRMLPILCNLIEIERDEEGIYYPSYFVFEPDYLYDVTAIAECFGAQHSHELGFLLRKFHPNRSSAPLTIGNIANYFLDQLLYHPEVEFGELMPRVFALDPLGLATMSDEEVRDMVHKLRQHFQHLKRVVTTDFQEIGIDKNQSYIEPAFYSTKYGIQGRLDLLCRSADHASIIELKSGKPFRANSFGLNNNHYHQTLLYDMLIESVYGYRTKRSNFILYSQPMSNNLKHAPTIKAQQRETAKYRNKLLLLEHRLQHADDLVEVIRDFHVQWGERLNGFQLRDFNRLKKAFAPLRELDRMYCTELVRFVLREQRLSKLGDDSQERLSGLASLWRDDLSIKMDQFNILNHMEIVEDHSTEENPLLVLHKTAESAELSNFRVGDIGVLYADHGRQDDILKDQVFKCSVIAVDGDRVTIRLRSRQEQDDIFSVHPYWNVEHDVLDTGYYGMTRNILEYAEADESYRDLILGLSAPTVRDVPALTTDSELTNEQHELLHEIIAADDYYLLWGPPGTGKTSMIVRRLADYYYQHTEHRVLYMAYTNRAVDEICHAISAAGLRDHIIRVGSRYSTDPSYADLLLESRLGQLSRRDEVVEMAGQTRIYVGTVASVLGKHALFELLDFDIAIIDEASQILDANLIGLLSRFDKFVLIGDHQQLPAVVLQDQSNSSIQSEALREIGIENFADSLFERLYRRAAAQGWTTHIGQLSYQGRMHQDLLDFPNDRYYQNTLRLLPQLDRLRAEYLYSSRDDGPLSSQRMLYLSSEVDIVSDSIKVNEHEAVACVALIMDILDLYDQYGRDLTPESIGIITPYRAQIARILQEMEQQGLGDLIGIITVDTVERYQGGARDIIIMSTCVNYAFQLRGLVSMSRDGIDRKLNVAFTRAREQFILIGNQEILSKDPGYADLMSRCTLLD